MIKAKFWDGFLRKSGGRETHVKKNRFFEGIEKPLASTFLDETGLDPYKTFLFIEKLTLLQFFHVFYINEDSLYVIRLSLFTIINII